MRARGARPVHLRIVAPSELAGAVRDCLESSRSVFNLITLPGAAAKPEGDVLLCDVAREDASVLIADLSELGVPSRGSIAVQDVDSELSDFADAAERAAPGMPTDAIVWEEVESRTSESTELSLSFITFMTVATLLSAVGLITESTILIVGAMVVGPEFGPLAALCVALVQRRREFARRSLSAIAVGFPAAIAITWGFTAVLLALGLTTTPPAGAPAPFTTFVSAPNVFSVIVAVLAGVAGMVSLTTAKSGALVGVLISVTTIPAAAAVGIAVAYGHWPEALDAALQLLVNLGAIVIAGVVTLLVQRRAYATRVKGHQAARRAAS